MHSLKKTSIFLLAIAICYSISFKANAQLVLCDLDSSGLIPLNDLGTGYYLGKQGGFFPGGTLTENPASTHFKKGKNFAKNLQPLDSLGNINYDGGVVLMGGFGPSVPGHMLDHFVPIVRDTADDTYLTNICFDAINMGAGGKGLDYAIGADSTKYWNQMLKKIDTKGYTAEQLQVGWMYFNDKYDSLGAESTFPESPERIADDLAYYLSELMERFPNIKIMFVSGRHYGGFADSTLEQYPAIGEPASYWNNFAVKWLIERQIVGNPALKYFGTGAKVPFITWGPYYWADGGIPRATDGVLYQCSDFSDEDGFHLTDSTYERDAIALMDVMYTSEFAKYYVKDGAKWSSCVPYLDSIHRTQPDILEINPVGITLYPNPATEDINIYRHNVNGKLYAVEIYNEVGQLVVSENTNGNIFNTIPIDVADLKTGLYILRAKMDDPVTGQVMWFQERFIKQ